MRLRTTFAISLAVAACCALAVAARVSSAQARRNVSLLLVNGKVFTGDARGTIAEAVAVEGDRIVAVGSTREMDARYNAARRVDLKGRLVTAGFNDAHLHFLNGGLALFRVDLNGARTLEEAKRRVAEKARELPEGAWLLGRGWDQTLWGGQWPTKAALDEAAPRNPVFVQRVDGHTSWANSLALSKANVTRAKRDPEEFNSLKVDPLRLRISAVKGYVDGTLGSRTAAMLAPFDDDPHNSGIPRMTPEELNAKVVALDAAGFQVTLHAIGDKANRMALDAYQQAYVANGFPLEGGR